MDVIADSLNNKVDLPSVATSQDDIDFVIEWQAPTSANNYTWYRKYKSGWVEQGGRTSNFTNTGASTSDVKTITMPIEMSSKTYSVLISKNYDLTLGNASISGYANRSVVGYALSTTQVYVDQFANTAASGTSVYAEWHVCGMAA